MDKIRKILGSNYLSLLLIPAVFALFLFHNQKPASQVENPDGYTLRIIPLALQYTDRYYVDENRIEPEEMLRKGLNKLENSSDEILIEYPEDGPIKNIRVQVNNDSKDLTNLDIYNLQSARNVLRDVFFFVVPRLRAPDIDTLELEFAVADGMLKALDMHSGIITPDIYREFMIETQGSFGGLGIVIGIREGELTVISPIDGTPAHRAGILPNDRIVQIENESTVNMSLVEAVGKLRGEEGTDVSIYIDRDAFSEPRKFTITRDTIKIQSVEHFMLDDGVLYMKVRDFQKNTLDGMKEAIADNRKEITGVILDLRGNPGGLLDQAEKVSDFFLESGIVVTTKVGNSEKSYRARKTSTEYKGELVVLVDSGSASASEIVAGALKNNDRAIVIGEKTFGKGSVQQIFELNEGAALKLTIANYYTPGDISIQDIGIIPDIALQKAVISEDVVIFNHPERRRKPVDIQKDVPEPIYTIKYLDMTHAVDDPDEMPLPDEALSDDERLEKLKNDFAISVAKAVLEYSANIKREKTLEDLKTVLLDLERSEEQKIINRWSNLGIDWSYPEDADSMEGVNIKAEVKPSEVMFSAGEKGDITVKVTNTGSEPVYRLAAVTESDNSALKGKELVFGKLEPGESREWSVTFDIPRWMSSRNDEIRLKFSTPWQKDIPEHGFEITTVAAERPSFSYNYEIIDDGRLNTSGNGDGRLQEGETAALLFRTKNTGDGTALNTVVNLKNLSGDRIFLDTGRIEFDTIEPGEKKSGVFFFRVNDASGDIEFDLQIIEESLREAQVKTITIPVVKYDQKFTQTDSAVRVASDNTPVYGGSYRGAPEIAQAYGGSVFRAVLENNEWIKIDLGEDRFGWVKRSAVSLKETDRLNRRFEQSFNHPPRLSVSDLPMVTDKEKVTVKGTAFDSDSIENISLFKGDRKVGLSAPGSRDYRFSFSVRLDEGVNILNVVGKDTTGLYTRETLTIRRTTIQ